MAEATFKIIKRELIWKETFADIQSLQSEYDSISRKKSKTATELAYAEVESEYQKGVVLKAVDENSTIIGSVRAYYDNNTVYIGKLMVHPEKQGQGIGTQLLVAIENEYPQQRYELFTSSKSKKNIELYEKFGYEIFSEKQITDELKFVYLEKFT